MTATPRDQGNEDPALSDLLARALEALEEAGTSGVEELLARHPEQASTIRRRLRVLGGMGMLPEPEAPPVEIPERLGEFVIKERLGSGGMGVVYLADQPSLHREVALKLIRPEHLYFPRARERFTREIEAVARLQHPSIVRVYSTGVENGLPYFTMERVEGVSLDRLLVALGDKSPAQITEADVVAALAELGGENRAVIPAERSRSWVEISIQWMRELADAVAYAHQCGVLHRDIKPSNVMITWSMRAMLLDFGLAHTSDGADLTRTGAQLGSLPYMAPEQVRGETDRVGARTDVYALGVVLYELLTSRNPFQVGSSSEDETRQRIVAAASPPVRQSNPGISWDAETVCSCAMAPEPEQRYATVAALAGDLQNLLDLRPINARRPGAKVRVQRWIRRRPRLAGAAAMGLAFVVIAPSAFAWSQYRTNQRIERESAARADILDFFRNELLAAASPGGRTGKEATVREVLDVAAEKIEGRFPDRPLVEVAIRTTLGDTYRNLGVSEAAEKHLTRALALQREHVGDRDRGTLSIERKLLMVWSALERYEEVEPRLRRMLEVSREVLGPEDRDTMATTNNLGLLLTRLHRYAEAEEMLTLVVDFRLKHLGEDDASTQAAMCNLGLVYYRWGRLAEAEPWIRREYELCRRRVGDADPDTLISHNNLGNLLAAMGRHEEAADALQRVVELSRQVLGPGHLETLRSTMNLCGPLIVLKRYDEADAMFRRLAEDARALPADHPLPLLARIHHAQALRRSGRYQEGLQVIEDVRAQCADAATGARARLAVDAASVEAKLLAESGQRERAAEAFAALIDGWQAEPDAALADNRLQHARNLIELGRYPEAEEQLSQALAFHGDAFSEDTGQQEILKGMVLLHERQGNDAVAHWRERLAAWNAAAKERRQRDAARSSAR